MDRIPLCSVLVARLHPEYAVLVPVVAQTHTEVVRIESQKLARVHVLKLDEIPCISYNRRVREGTVRVEETSA